MSFCYNVNKKNAIIFIISEIGLQKFSNLYVFSKVVYINKQKSFLQMFNFDANFFVDLKMTLAACLHFQSFYFLITFAVT